ncbi:Six-hairpin glycosidase-like protein [Microdochium trichocladiopsis]|uniref:Six-hairpin glycosidase-like protein n=1 Tax=Microdochium trichocladiopsis TaxID=1682393 RepID=A0A9P9BTW0_9PEZI|nr:Six-hairpin glycosidase-like protein [Microdochium trichocladiopsis]KAH7035882.1 Six-hairpin glycosidase-like protein [Microdochium trichocladiopsis]
MLLVLAATTCGLFFSFGTSAPIEPLGPGGTPFLLDKSQYFSHSFLETEIPYIDIPDQLIKDVYYYRWTSLERNLRYTTQGTGYMTTEFVQPVWYAQAFGTINAAAGHHLDEAKWLRSPKYTDDYFQLYARGPANSTQYTEWILHAAERKALVSGDKAFLAAHLDDLQRAVHEWDKVLDKDVGLYYYQPVWDAQELSLPGFVADPNNMDWDLRKDGPDTYRPSHNAYMVANCRAVARAAEFAGNAQVQAEYTKMADDIEAAMFKHMWDPKKQFFMDIIRPNNPNLTRLDGREQVGVFPFRFGIGLNETYAQPAVDALFDTQGFLTPYGPPTLEVRDPWYMAEKPDSYCCYWNGQSWPYSTSHTLKSLAAIYRSGTTNLTSDQYYLYLKTYAQTQQKDGHPYVAESHYPHKAMWSADGFNHSEHYAHSTNNDDVISGLLGIVPQADDTLVISPIVPSDWKWFGIQDLNYHGHRVTVLYDADGTRYGKGIGLTVFIDNEQIYQGPDMKATVKMPPPRIPDKDVPVNIAANPDGVGRWPRADATYTFQADWSYKAIDGVVYYDSEPDNRWTNYQSPNQNDTLTVTFPRFRNISSVTLAAFSDVDRNGQIDLPWKVEVWGSTGLLATVSDSDLVANDRNTISFNETETSFVALNLYNQPGRFVGLCEVEVWVPPAGSVYHAADALLKGETVDVLLEGNVNGVKPKSVVGAMAADSIVSFSGVLGPAAAGSSTVTIVYANAGESTLNLALEVNQVPQAVGVALKPTEDGAYASVDVPVKLASGKNFVTLKGGSPWIKLDTLTVS